MIFWLPVLTYFLKAIFLKILANYWIFVFETLFVDKASKLGPDSTIIIFSKYSETSI
jgi:hypothetical protein